MALPDRLQHRIVLLLAAGSLACAAAPRSGEEVHIGEESAIIVWDATTKTQHFIRRATFETEAKDFGFLVPTPAVPELAEASSQAFVHLDRLIDPPELRKAIKSASRGEAQSLGAVTVVATARVAGMDAAVLAASDAGALDRWLKENGYASSPALVDWYKPYIEKRWYLTAFKIAAGFEPGKRPKRFEADAVRMSFRTDQPFFPYREPRQDNAGKSAVESRQLKIYFIADERFDGKLATRASWTGRPKWSGPLDPGARNELAQQLRLPADRLATSTRLTLFVDPVVERPGDADLVFSRSADQSELRPELELLNALKAGREASDRDALIGWTIAALAIAAGIVGLIRRRKRT